MSRKSSSITLFLVCQVLFHSPAFSQLKSSDRKVQPSIEKNKGDAKNSNIDAPKDDEQEPTSKTIETPVGPATISVEEKEQPEPALKPYLLQVTIKCQSGKKFRQSVSVCDSDLEHSIDGDLLKVNYFYAEPDALGTEQEEDGPECDEENPFELQIKLSEACAKGKTSKSTSDKKSSPKKK